MQVIFSKNIIKKINLRDFIRMLCGIALIFQALLLVVDNSSNILKNTSKNILFISLLTNYMFSALFLLLGLLLFVGLKTKTQLLLSFILLIITVVLTFINHGLAIKDLILTSIILVLQFIILITGYGNVTMDNLFRN